MKYVLGIDPGLGGAAAILDDEGVLTALTDLPIMRADKLAWIDGNVFQSWLIEHAQFMPLEAFVERVSSSPQQGVASAFTFGVGFGSILAIIQARHIPLHLVTPGKWKRELNLAGKDKKQA